MKKIALIGSTGSIGRQTLSVVSRLNREYRIISLAGGNNSQEFLSQTEKFCPKIATLINPLSPEITRKFASTDFFFGEEAFLEAITDEADIVVVALVGFTGIKAVLKAIEKGKTVALANKESLVVGGELVSGLKKEKGVNLIPIDSEHSAIFQALSFDYATPFEKIILTASGGAFRDKTKDELAFITAKDALAHPNWNMGAKITIDCATLVNKAFEVIEARWLYDAPFDKIDVVVHRESIIHSMVGFRDGSVIAQMGYPTMEIPIQLALTYPKREETGFKIPDFSRIGSLNFSSLDREKFPCFDAVVNAGKKGGLYPAVCNGANDEAVGMFLKGEIGYNDIYSSVCGALDKFSDNISGTPAYSDLEYADSFGARYVREKFGRKS